MVEVEDLRLVFRHGREETLVLDGVSFSLPAGESLALIGPSGCGKTSLLYVLAGLLTPTAGRVAVAGAPVVRGREGTALILQDYGLLPWKTVRENAALGLRIRGRSPEAADRVLRDLGLWDLRNRYPAQLSGGQRQRVGIARALALDPDLLLMDEPFSALDALTREELQDLVLSVWRQRRTTLVLVTHDIAEAVYLGRRILVLSSRPGRVLAEISNPGAGRPEYRREPAFHQMVNQVREVLARGWVHG
ncbi:MAG: ABC transporter ATP-binding protein [Firmicutes bacterium]|nr:ABC transporter ATP-binding protein [Bacillota bacterium]